MTLKQEILNRCANLEAQKEQFVANANAAQGAINSLNAILQLLEKNLVIGESVLTDDKLQPTAPAAAEGPKPKSADTVEPCATDGAGRKASTGKPNS